MQTLTRRGVGDAAAGLGLHFLHVSEGPFSHDAGHIYYVLHILNENTNVHTIFMFGTQTQYQISIEHISETIACDILP